MAKYIVNIILVTACLFTYTSCIRKMNLYDENRNTGQDNNEKDTDSTPVYMYPFDKETANVTAEIIIHTKKEIQTKDINVEIPHLKYNKTCRVYLNVLEENVRANKFYKKCGFRYEGTFQDHLCIHGAYKNLNWYGIRKEDFRR